MTKKLEKKSLKKIIGRIDGIIENNRIARRMDQMT